MRVALWSSSEQVLEPGSLLRRPVEVVLPGQRAAVDHRGTVVLRRLRGRHERDVSLAPAVLLVVVPEGVLW
ncbi:MAG: hypothetical protein M3445_00085 [Actinomycetota bacterium]|nr:hypothetical protein [Actinomycetota bacterium]